MVQELKNGLMGIHDDDLTGLPSTSRMDLYSHELSGRFGITDKSQFKIFPLRWSRPSELYIPLFMTSWDIAMCVPSVYEDI
jgi:hypothetical protein